MLICMNMAKSSPLIVFNWKENPRTEREAVRLFSVFTGVARGIRSGEIVVCPPVVYLEKLSGRSSPASASFFLGAQDVFWEDDGAYTGEIGPATLRSIGKNMRYVIIGHSERRRYLHETDEMVNKKARAALAAGLRVILCVGEPLAVRKKGIAASRRYVKNQLKKDLQNIANCKLKIENLIIAYEPIWAIGTGRNCPPALARDMAKFIKETTAILPANRQVPVLYGGSVNGADAAAYLCYHEINGVLVGGASLKTAEIKKIIKNISHYGKK